MPEEYLTKSQVIALVSLETGLGRSVIERTMEALAAEGKILLEENPLDRRRYRVRKSDVAVIVQALRDA